MSGKRKTNLQDLSTVSQRTLRRRIASELGSMLNYSDPVLLPDHEIICDTTSDDHVSNQDLCNNYVIENNSITDDSSYLNKSENKSNLGFLNSFEFYQSSYDSSSTEENDTDINQYQVNFVENDYDSHSDHNFIEKLKCWAIKYKIKQNALDALLGILRNETIGKSLPKVARTFLKTPRHTAIYDMKPGHYCHFGMKSGLGEVLDKLEIDGLLDSLNFSISLKVSTDGLPLSDSSTSQLWPILGSIVQTSHVFVIGIYHGISKPSDSNTFLEYFVNEIIDLSKNGFLFKDTIYKVCIYCIVCDAPAKSFVTKTKGHAGYNSCSKCCQEGEFLYNRICFPVVQNNVLKTDAGFRRQEYDDYHQGVSILLNIPNFKPISQIPFDYMHLVCIGVFKKVLHLWLNGKPECKIVRLQHSKITSITKNLIDLRSYITNDFARRPQDIVHLGKWKATELRQMLLYTCPVVLYGVINTQVYEHVLTLHISIRILCSKKLLDLHSDYAKLLLQHFVETFITLYGKHYVSHNVHGLLHLVDDAKLLGPLDNFSAFEFENCLRLLKRQLRKSAHPLQQLHRRYSEESSIISYSPRRKDDFLKKHSDGPILNTSDIDKQFRKARINNSFITVSSPDNYCMIDKNNIVVTVCNIVYDKDLKCMVILGRKFLEYSNIYQTPCKSSIIDCYLVDNLSSILEKWPIKNIKYKCLALPWNHNRCSHKLAIFPLLHSDCTAME